MTGRDLETLRRPAEAGRRGFSSLWGVLQRDDPVMHKMTKRREDAYAEMESEAAVRTSILQRVRGVSQHGWEVVPGTAGTAKAERLRRFAEAVLFHLWREDNFPLFVDEILRTPFFGWGLWNLVWAPTRHDGRRVWTPRQAIYHRVWDFDLTTADENGHHHVIDTLGSGPGNSTGSSLGSTDARQSQHRRGGILGRVYDEPADALRWFRVTAGSTESPYGVAELSYHWVTWNTLVRLSGLGEDVLSRNGLGILRVTAKENAEGTNTEAQQLNDIREMLDVLRSDGALLQRSGYLVDWLQSNSGIRDYYALLAEMRGLLRMALLGQNLTSEVKEGSYAAAVVHGGVLDAINTGDARLAGSALTRLVRLVIEVNYGPQEIRDLPTVRSGAARTLDPERVRLALEAGLALDGEALAHEWALPLAEGVGRQVAVLAGNRPTAARGFHPALPNGHPAGVREADPGIRGIPNSGVGASQCGRPGCGGGCPDQPGINRAGALTPVPSPAQGRGAPPPYQGTGPEPLTPIPGRRPPSPAQGRGAPPPSPRNAATDADAQQAGLDRLQAASLPEAEPALRGAARGMLEHWLREHPDPFA